MTEAEGQPLPAEKASGRVPGRAETPIALRPEFWLLGPPGSLAPWQDLQALLTPPDAWAKPPGGVHRPHG